MRALHNPLVKIFDTGVANGMFGKKMDGVSSGERGFFGARPAQKGTVELKAGVLRGALCPAYEDSGILDGR